MTGTMTRPGTSPLVPSAAGGGALRGGRLVDEHSLAEELDRCIEDEEPPSDLGPYVS